MSPAQLASAAPLRCWTTPCDEKARPSALRTSPGRSESTTTVKRRVPLRTPARAQPGAAASWPALQATPATVVRFRGQNTLLPFPTNLESSRRLPARHETGAAPRHARKTRRPAPLDSICRHVLKARWTSPQRIPPHRLGKDHSYLRNAHKTSSVTLQRDPTRAAL